jgi:hypothetical protein
MRYKDGDSIFGQIYKDEVPLIKLHEAVVKTNIKLSTPNAEVFEFESSVMEGTPLIEGDKCRLVDGDSEVEGDSEIELEVISVATGTSISQIFFRFTQS